MKPAICGCERAKLIVHLYTLSTYHCPDWAPAFRVAKYRTPPICNSV